MNKALLILYILHFVKLLLGAHLHGKPRTGNYSFSADLFGSAVSLTLLWWALGWKFF
jgi:hypothetical protein